LAEARAAKRVRVAAAVVWDGPRLLMTQRPPGGPLGLQWEFPGGKLEDGESPEAALVREVREELGVAAEAHETLAVHSHDYAHGVHVDVIFIRCTLASFEFTPAHAVHAARWVLPREAALHEVLEGDRDFLVGLGASRPA
jgi:8-oxo-dGTP diphosphatase